MAYNRRKRKVKKDITTGECHIHATYNNTIVTITDENGGVISWASVDQLDTKEAKRKLHLLLDNPLKQLEK